MYSHIKRLKTYDIPAKARTTSLESLRRYKSLVHAIHEVGLAVGFVALCTLAIAICSTAL